MTYINQDQHISQKAAPIVTFMLDDGKKDASVLKFIEKSGKKTKGWQPVKVNYCLSRKCHGRWEKNPPTVTDNIW